MLCALTTNAATTNKEVLVWPALPNETIQMIAAKLYPNHADLQRKFVFKAIRLNAENKLNLAENEIFTTPQAILIPAPESLKDSIRAIKPSSLGTTAAQPKLSMSYYMAPPKNGLSPPISTIVIAPSAKMSVTAIKQAETTTVATQTVTLLAIKPVAKPNVNPKSADLPSANVDTQVVNKQPQAWHFSTIDLKAFSLPVTVNQLLWLVSLLLAVLGLFSLLLARIAHRKKNALLQEVPIPSLHSPDSGVLLREYPVDTHSDTAEKLASNATESLNDTFATPPTAPEFEEHGDRQILEEAKAYEKKDRVDEAIEHIKWAIRAKQKVSIELWLYLLDLYRQQNRQDDFENYAKAMHQTYNVMIPQWQEKKVAMVVAQTLEDFPHLAQKLCAIWSSAAPAMDFLQGLVDDNRDGERLGFSRAVVDEILLLCLVLEARDKES